MYLLLHFIVPLRELTILREMLDLAAYFCFYQSIGEKYKVLTKFSINPSRFPQTSDRLWSKSTWKASALSQTKNQYLRILWSSDISCHRTQYSCASTVLRSILRFSEPQASRTSQRVAAVVTLLDLRLWTSQQPGKFSLQNICFYLKT